MILRFLLGIVAIASPGTGKELKSLPMTGKLKNGREYVLTQVVSDDSKQTLEDLEVIRYVVCVFARACVVLTARVCSGVLNAEIVEALSYPQDKELDFAGLSVFRSFAVAHCVCGILRVLLCCILLFYAHFTCFPSFL